MASYGSLHKINYTPKTDSIGYVFHPSGEAGRLRLHYTTTRWNGEKVDADYWIDLETTPCHFGGQRWWFVCPLTKRDQSCGRRCGKLYLPPGALYFGCRACYDLTYTSCQESHKYDKLYASIAGEIGCSPDQVRKVLSRW